jgi:hypothetical protein
MTQDSALHRFLRDRRIQTLDREPAHHPLFDHVPMSPEQLPDACGQSFVIRHKGLPHPVIKRLAVGAFVSAFRFSSFAHRGQFLEKVNFRFSQVLRDLNHHLDDQIPVLIFHPVNRHPEPL